MRNGESSYRRFLCGEQDAFDEIVRQYFDSLILFINRYVRDIHVAEDIAIDSFAYILANKRKYNFKVRFKTYLFMIGRCRALNYIKHNKLIKLVALEEAENVSLELKTLEDTVIDNELKSLVNIALAQLPDNMRLAVHLVFFEDLSYAQTAKVLNKNKKQIDNLLYRAKCILREKLGKDCDLF